MRIKRENTERGVLEEALNAFNKVTNLNATVQQTLHGPDAKFQFWVNEKKVEICR